MSLEIHHQNLCLHSGPALVVVVVVVVVVDWWWCQLEGEGGEEVEEVWGQSSKLAAHHQELSHNTVGLLYHRLLQPWFHYFHPMGHHKTQLDD